MSVVKAGQKGVTIYDPTKFYNGYNLFFSFGEKDAWLMDMEGRLVHRWRLPYVPGGHGYLLPNGHLVYSGRIRTREEIGYGWPAEMGALGGIFIEFDWDGNIVWQAETIGQGHDFHVMPNGHIMYVAWTPEGIVPDEIAAKLKGGRPGTEVNGKIWGDIVAEMDRNGKTVWKWLTYEHLDPEIDAIAPLDNRCAWPYINAVWVCRDGNILLSARFCNEVIKIDHSTGKVIGRYGRGKIYHQHDCRELDNGNITVFDNGTHRHEYKVEHSSIFEIDPKTDKVVWEYQADPPSDFFSAHSGGAERQPNGNTVIIESDKGRAFEVTPKSEIVWEYVHPRYVNFIGRLGNIIWRFHRYAPDYPGLKGKDLDPKRLAWENRIWGPDAFAKDIKPCIF